MAQVFSATVGDVVRVRRHVLSSKRIIVTAPDGSVFSFPADRNSFELWVPQVGAWTFRWDDEIDVRQIDVAEAVVIEDEDAREPLDLPSGRIFSRGA